ncbi:MAG TPA: hypothetical protein VIE38_03910 [Gaiellaceae bacterium]|jgi:hypothetical protein
MTPEQRDRNVFRARRITGAIAGASIAACGLFAGLAASATKHVAATTKTKATTTTPTTTRQATTTTTIAPVVVTPTQSAPVASSGGS